MTGVIAAGHPATAAAAADILRQGGNAVDAAVAAAFASFVAEAVLVSIGGGGIAQVYNPATNEAIVYDFFSTMPGLTRDQPPATMDFRQILVDFGPAQQPFYVGRASVAVPGVVAGLCAMLAERGRLPLHQILTPAIQLAREGVLLSQAHEYIAYILMGILTDTPGLAAIFAPTGRLVKAGERLYFHDLAQTLSALGESGPDLFYAGTLAEKICADQLAHGGLLTAADLARYQVHRLDPITITYRDCTIYLPPPSSNGGMLIAFALKLLAAFPVAELRHNSFAHLRLLLEVMRHTLIARAEWNQNQKNAAQQVDKFLSEANINIYRARLDQALSESTSKRGPHIHEGPPNTTHISVADETGMLVGITTSAGENAGFVVGDTGIMLNNMLGETDLHPGGFHQLPAGQRLATMMSPVVVARQGRPVLVVGSGGSSRIRTAILQLISNVVDFTLPLEAAVAASRVHFEADTAQLEGGIAPAIAAQLTSAGFKVNLWPEQNMFFGGTHAIASLTPGQWVAVGDKRRGGTALRV